MEEFLRVLDCREENPNKYKGCVERGHCDVVLSDDHRQQRYQNNVLNGITELSGSGVHNHNF